MWPTSCCITALPGRLSRGVAGKQPHQEHSDSSRCILFGPVCSRTILQVMTPGGALGNPETLVWTLAQTSPLTSSPAGLPIPTHPALKVLEASVTGHPSFGGPLPRGPADCQGVPPLHGLMGPLSEGLWPPPLALWDPLSPVCWLWGTLITWESKRLGTTSLQGVVKGHSFL